MLADMFVSKMASLVATEIPDALYALIDESATLAARQDDRDSLLVFTDGTRARLSDAPSTGPLWVRIYTDSPITGRKPIRQPIFHTVRSVEEIDADIPNRD